MRAVHETTIILRSNPKRWEQALNSRYNMPVHRGNAPLKQVVDSYQENITPKQPFHKIIMWASQETSAVSKHRAQFLMRINSTYHVLFDFFVGGRPPTLFGRLWSRRSVIFLEQATQLSYSQLRRQTQQLAAPNGVDDKLSFVLPHSCQLHLLFGGVAPLPFTWLLLAT